jgi:hypothetical protein
MEKRSLTVGQKALGSLDTASNMMGRMDSCKEAISEELTDQFSYTNKPTEAMGEFEKLKGEMLADADETGKPRATLLDLMRAGIEQKLARMKQALEDERVPPLPGALTRVFTAVQEYDRKTLTNQSLFSILFQEIEELSDILPRWQKNFMNIMKARTAQPGSVVFQYQESSPAFCILISGQVKKYCTPELRDIEKFEQLNALIHRGEGSDDEVEELEEEEREKLREELPIREKDVTAFSQPGEIFGNLYLLTDQRYRRGFF